ncbi:MAG: hypothetical protein V4560_16665 [Bacteroidota bacterium]
MKIFYLLISAVLLLLSCNSKNKNKVSSAESTTTQSQEPKDTLKTINEIKLILLDARCEKAELLLGKPDKKGRILSDLGGETYYMVYFKKVLDGGITKHLLLTIYTENGISDNSKINTVDAVYNTDSKYIDHGVSIKIEFPNVTSNGRAFTVGDRTQEWWDIHQ